MRAAVTFIACLISVSAAFAQTFDVASLKPHIPPPGKPIGGSNQRGGPGTDDPGQITIDNRTLRTLIIDAYGLKGYQLVNPEWLANKRFDIIAKVPAGTTKQQARIMMRNLLVERFQLKFHRETKDLPVYEMTVAKGGVKMKPNGTQAGDAAIDLKQLTHDGDGFLKIPTGTKGIAATFMPGRAQLTAVQQTVKQLVTMLADRVDRPIIDATGLTAAYDFTLLWSPESNDQAVAGLDPNPAVQIGDAPPIFEALERQLGLKLTPKKLPTEMMIVDGANRVPAEN